MERVLEILRGGGFSLDLAHHSIHVLGSRVLGFTQDLFDDSDKGRVDPEMAALMARQMAGAYPHISRARSCRDATTGASAGAMTMSSSRSGST